MDYAALAISIIALLVALPPTFQMFCGRPCLRIEFIERDQGDAKKLICGISNAPIRNKVLRSIGVRRDSAMIFADFQVIEVGTERVIVDTTRALLVDTANIVANGEEGTLRARLDDHFPVRFTCAIHQDGDAAAIVNLRAGVKTPLSQGRYRVDVKVICGTTLHRDSREISVGTIPGSTYWIPV